MEKQTVERVDLYRQRNLPGDPIVVTVNPTEVQDNTPTDGVIWVAMGELTNKTMAGALGMRAEDLKGWLQGIKSEEDPETAPNNKGDCWKALVRLVQTVWEEGTIPIQLGWMVTVLIPKGGGYYRGIGLLEPLWKVIERVMDHQLEVIALHDSLHGCRNGQGTGTAVIKAKLTQQLAHIEQAPFYGVFIDLKKAFDTMDRERCLIILETNGVRPNMCRLIRHFWDKATNVCCPSGNYGTPFKAGRGVTQGSPLLAKLFKIMVNMVVREWLWILRNGLELEGEELVEMMETLFAIFYVNNAYVALQDPVFLQWVIDMLVKVFEPVGLVTNVKKMQAMTCAPSKIRLQLPANSYCRMRGRYTSTADWDACTVTCRECRKNAGKLPQPHLADLQEIYQQQVVL